MKRTIITGGAGFIGSHTADRFVAEGWDVHVVDNLSSGKRQQVPGEATFHEIDIRSRDAAELVAQLKPDVLVHLAAQMDVRKSVADPAFDADANIMGSLNLLEAVRRESPETRVVFASSGGAVYGDATTPPNIETFPKDPESPYAVSKLAVETYLAYYARVHAIEYAAMRFGNVYGPRQDPHGEAGVVAIFCGRLLERSPLTVFGDGLQTRDYVFVSDVVEANWRASTALLPPAGLLDARAFNIGTGVPTTVLRLTEELSAAAGVRPHVLHAAERRGEQRTSFLNVTKAGSVLGWQPRVALTDGLRRSYEWFAQRHAGERAGAAT
jgi:UDP-glucose 4-epimerase